MIKIVKIIKTCNQCPSQWDGWDENGKYYYFRYRHGHFSVDSSDTMERWSMGKEKALIDKYRKDDPLGGYLTYNELKEEVKDILELPESDARACMICHSTDCIDAACFSKKTETYNNIPTEIEKKPLREELMQSLERLNVGIDTQFKISKGWEELYNERNKMWIDAEDKLNQVRNLLEENGCDCECNCHPEEHSEICELCLACRIGNSVQR